MLQEGMSKINGLQDNRNMPEKIMLCWQLTFS